MEKNLDGLSYEVILSALSLGQADLRTYSPLAFAYIGDTVFDMIVRSMLMANGNAPVDRLHKKASRVVNAKTQAGIANEIFPLFTEEEADIFRRAKNTKMHSSAKNASLSDYRKATGLEAVFGYLYMKGETKRLLFLCQKALSHIGEHHEG